MNKSDTPMQSCYRTYCRSIYDDIESKIWLPDNFPS